MQDVWSVCPPAWQADIARWVVESLFTPGDLPQRQALGHRSTERSNRRHPPRLALPLAIPPDVTSTLTGEPITAA